MSPVLSGYDDRDPSDDPKPDCLVSVIVPEEFVGTSMGELQKRGGMIKKMDVNNRTVVIHALIPEHQCDKLALAITEWTRHRGKVERQPRVNE
jgi:translation elongation factor EF-G